MSPDVSQDSLQAEERQAVIDQIRQTGARATPARVRVLQLLRAATGAMAHHQIEECLGPSVMDRVTLYRVLDWLVDCGLAHKSADAQRVFRYSAAVGGEHQQHVHFHCETCGMVFCLDEAPPAPPPMPDGFSLSHMDFDLRGRCALCADHNTGSSTRGRRG